MRDWLAWLLVRAARRLTTLGDIDDTLKRVETMQRAAFKQR